MTGRMQGKVAFITGAARGQGRSHAVRLAEAGADIIAIDICASIPSNSYPLASKEDLADTVRAVEALGRRIVATVGDVRSRDEVAGALLAGVTEFGRLDTLVANAGILPVAMGDPDPMQFVDAVDVDLVGVMNTVAVTVRHISDGGSIVITGSNAAMMPGGADNPAMGPGSAGYGWAKRTITTYVEQLAVHFAPRFIRVNAIHPTNVNTDMLHNKGLYSVFRPDLAKPTREDVEPVLTMMHPIPIPYVEPIDISNAVLFLASDESRYVTGQQLRVDAGGLLRIPTRLS